ncbi:MAG: outer membrane protein transport protein [Acidobacteria bacterium]|nr:outer membrane protein transport protein [Acidobacteriota bacterium]
MRKIILVATAAIILTMTTARPVSLLASDGYFSQGYGTCSQGMGGAGVAFPLGPLSPATNPASLVLSDPGWEFGVGLFNPNRHYEVIGDPSGYPGTFGLAPGLIDSGSRLFPVPHLGFARPLGSSASIGIAVFGNGGMNTNYSARTFGFSPTGINMSQLFVAPTYSMKLNARNAVGVTALVGYQMFKAEGLQAFSAFSSDSKNLTNNKTDSAFGFGVRVGYVGQLSKSVSVGAAYQSKVYMSRFKKYAGLFAEQGGFDVPSNWTAGVGIKLNDAFDLAFDVQQMRYSDVKSVGNLMLPNLMQAALGATGGAGFGWKDMTVVKTGLQYRVGGGWTWRAGYSYGKQPIPSSEVLFNILAPGVIEHHATFGISKDLGRGRAFDVAVMRAFNKTVSGPNPLEAPGQQTITLGMNQWNVTIGYSIRLK